MPNERVQYQHLKQPLTQSCHSVRFPNVNENSQYEQGWEYRDL